MDIDIGLLGALCREGMSAFYEHNIEQQMLENQAAREAFFFIESHWKEYKTTPESETVKSETGIDLLIEPKEPLGFWCEQIKKRTIYSTVQDALIDVSGLMEKMEPLKAVECLRDLLYKIDSQVPSNNRPQSIFANPQEMIEDYEKAKQGILGIPTPWPTMTTMTRGWQPGDFTLIAARPSVGKTWTALIIAKWAWQKGYKVLLGSTEMAHKSLKRRVAALAFNLPYGSIREGHLNEAEEKHYKDSWLTTSKDERFLLLGDGFDVTLNSIESAIIDFEPDLVCIDGLYLMKTKNRFDRKHEQASDIFNQTKAIGKRRNVSVVATTQMNRDSGQGGQGNENLDRLAFTDAAGQVADWVFFLNQTDQMKKSCQMEFQPAKMRESDYIKNMRVNWDFKRNDFSEIRDDFMADDDVITPEEANSLPKISRPPIGVSDPW